MVPVVPLVTKRKSVMRSTLILSAVLVMVAAAAQANDGVVKATLADEPPGTFLNQPRAKYIECQTSEAAPAEPSALPPEPPAEAAESTPTTKPATGSCADSGCASGGCASGGCAADGCASVCGNGSCCEDSACRGCGRLGKCKTCSHSCAATLSGNGCCNVCNMPPHFLYYPVDHGYYYFRPYNYRHIMEHQEAVMSWGGDPRNPYSNKMFEEIYEELEANDWETMPIQMPAEDLPSAPAAQEVPSVPVSPTATPRIPTAPMPIIDPAVDARKLNELRMISHQR